MVKLTRGLAAALLVAACSAAQAAPTLTGEYAEARTCNVYTGACHANGEAVTMGREALMAWHVTRGSAEGQELDGLNAVAVVEGQENLAQPDAARSTVLYVDAGATESQRAALAQAIEQKCGAVLGKVAAVKTAPIQFTHEGVDYTVRIPGVAYLKTTRYACDHCVMPHQVWYDPFVHLQSSMVAKAALSEFKGAPELSARWSRSDENSSFVGSFAL